MLVEVEGQDSLLAQNQFGELAQAQTSTSWSRPTNANVFEFQGAPSVAVQPAPARFPRLSGAPGLHFVQPTYGDWTIEDLREVPVAMVLSIQLAMLFAVQMFQIASGLFPAPGSAAARLPTRLDRVREPGPFAPVGSQPLRLKLRVSRGEFAPPE